MEYLDLKYNGADIHAAIFPFRRKEAHAYIRPSGKCLDTRSQIRSLAEGAEMLASSLRMRPVFMRWLLSDPANQTQYLPVEKVCATSVIGQSPLDGTKAALLVILEEDADFSDQGDGVWLDSHGKLWAGDDDTVLAADPRSMTVSYLEKLNAILARYGATLKDNCLRTWLFVRDIDIDYADVVRGRNEVFEREGLTRHTHFIASTGIQGASPLPSRQVAFNAIADIRIKPEQITYLYGRTHLNPTYEYGVAFERGTAVDYGDRRHVYISGTASIDSKGEIVAPDDINGQTMRMLENIGVLLEEAGCGWTDVAHMTVYLRDIADFQTVSGIMTARFPEIPKAIVLAPVCRPGWLVETECMAVKKTDNPDYAPY
ncbi:MAG: hypothetical protein K2M16_04440 [Muribaculaceae bacterium]|nr:hypothetical protein [Muribaculaceae bacterium]